MDISNIMTDLENYGDIAIVAKKYGMKKQQLKRLVFEYGGIEGKKILLKELEEKLPVDIIREEFEKGRSISEISKLLNIRKLTLEDWVRQYEYISGTHFSRSIGYKEREDINMQFDNIFQEYLDGITYSELALKYNASLTAIRNKIENKIYEKGAEKASKYKTEHQQNFFIRRYNQNDTTNKGVNNNIKIKGEDR